MFLLVVSALLCVTSVICAVSKSGGDYYKNSKNVTISNTDFQKLVKNDTVGSTAEQNLEDSINYYVETNVNSFVDSVRSFGEQELKSESRKKKQPDLMTRILPMMIIPFMLQTAIIPMMLTMLKFMLLKSAFIGKMAILLGLLNMFRGGNNQGGLYTHNIFLEHQSMPEKVAEQHYGYHAGEEYGAYTNRRKRTVR